jgi:hypothetical protein
VAVITCALVVNRVLVKCCCGTLACDRLAVCEDLIMYHRVVRR